MHYVIGDIHGQLPALQALIEKINFHPSADEICFLGDYTDWGCDNIGALLYVMDMEKKYPSVTALLGNHDLMMRETICSEEEIMKTLLQDTSWRRNCGDETLREYLNLPKEKQQEIREWLEERPIDLPVQIYDRKYWLCHALPLCAAAYYCKITGMHKEGESLEAAARKDIHEAVWYRVEMEENPCRMVPELEGYYIVRGHSITETRKVEAWDNDVINIDCGAKVFCQLLDDENWDDGEWTGEQEPSLTAFCLEDESVITVTFHEFRDLMQKKKDRNREIRKEDIPDKENSDKENSDKENSDKENPDKENPDKTEQGQSDLKS